MAWISFEKLHHFWDLNWPWLSLGNAFAEYYETIQWYEFTGIFGGSLWVLSTNAICFNFYAKYTKSKNKLLIPKWYRAVYSIILIPIIISLFMYKFIKIDNTKKMISIVTQPNINPYTEKFFQGDIISLKSVMETLENKIDEKTDFVFFPETMFPKRKSLPDFKKYKLYKELYSITNLFPNTSIISGANFYKREFNISKNTQIDNYNVAFQINNKDSLKIYKKSKLVLGSEYLPFNKYTKPFVNNIILSGSNFSIITYTKQEKRTIF